MLPDLRHELGGAHDLVLGGRMGGLGLRQVRFGVWIAYGMAEMAGWQIMRIFPHLRTPSNPPYATINYLWEVEDDVTEALLDVAEQEVGAGGGQLPDGRLARAREGHA